MIEAARDDDRKSAKINVESVQKGPYKSALGVRCVER